MIPPETEDTEGQRKGRSGSPGRADPRTLAALIEQVSDYAIYLLDVDGRVASWNAGAQKIKLYRAEEIIGEHFSRFYPEAARKAGWPERELVLARQLGRFEDEGWRLRKDGTRFWANVVITPLRDGSGKLTGFAKITRDLTERRRQEASLRRSEERLRLLVEGVKDSAIVSLTAQGRLETWNAGAQRIFGYAAAEIIGHDLHCFFVEEDLQRGAPSRELMAAARQSSETEGWRLRKDGTRFWAHVITTPVHDDDGELVGYTQVLRDMTESRRIEALEETGRRTNEFIAMLAHELRNPLAPIRNAIAVMQASISASPTMEPWVRIIDRQAAQLSRLLDDLLVASRVAHGEISVRRSRLDLRVLVARAVDAVRPSIDAHGHHIEVDLASEPLLLDGDDERLSEAFVNLLDNAVKFTPEGGRLEVAVQRDGGDALVHVRDNGIGMPLELRERAFDLFVQGKRELDRAGGGFGVGLPLVRRVVELHSGQVSASSAGAGDGTDIAVRLPLALPRAEARCHPRPDGREDDGPSLRILVVDDNNDSAETLSVLLRLWGHEVWTAGSGDEALSLARQISPAVVILDIGLPRMDGYEVARRLRRHPATCNARLIALTGYSQPEDRTRSFAAGFEEHLVKPVDCEQLRQSLRSMMGRTREQTFAAPRVNRRLLCGRPTGRARRVRPPELRAASVLRGKT